MSTKIRTLLGHLLSVLICTYSAGIVLWIAAWFLMEGNHGFRVLLTHNGGRLFHLIIPFAVAAILARRWRTLLTLLIPIGFFLTIAAPYLRPVPATNVATSEPAATSKLSVMTFNVLFTNAEFERIEAHLEAYQPDLVALQEVNNDLYTYLNEKLGDRYPYSLKSSDPDYSATAILSRHPVDEMYIVDLGEIRPAVVARLTVDGKRVKFISAHLFFYYGWWKYPVSEMFGRITEITDVQHVQVRRLLAEVQRHEDDVVILGCDCNAPETSETRLMLEREFTNSAKRTGWVHPQPDLPSLGPFYFPQRVDYIFHSGEIEAISVYSIYDNAGSDHLPVFGEFRLGGTEGNKVKK